MDKGMAIEQLQANAARIGLHYRDMRPLSLVDERAVAVHTNPLGTAARHLFASP